MGDIDQLTGEELQATPAFDEPLDSSESEGMGNDIDGQEVQGDIQDARDGKFVPLEVVESMREQTRELKEQNNQLLQLILSGRQQQPSEQKKEPELQFADDELITGAQLKSILTQYGENFQNSFQQIQEGQRQNYIAEQKESYMKQYPDYNDVVGTVMLEAQKDPAIAEILMRSPNPVAATYRYGKLLRGESMSEVATVKTKVNMENKINKNLNQPKTLSNTKTVSTKGGDEDFDSLYKKIMRR